MSATLSLSSSPSTPHDGQIGGNPIKHPSFTNHRAKIRAQIYGNLSITTDKNEYGYISTRDRHHAIPSGGSREIRLGAAAPGGRDAGSPALGSPGGRLRAMPAAGDSMRGFVLRQSAPQTN